MPLSAIMKKPLEAAKSTKRWRLLSFSLKKKGANNLFTPFAKPRGGDSMNYITWDELLTVIIVLITFADFIIRNRKK